MSKKKNSWVEALELFNKNSNVFCIPRKNSQGIGVVRQLQEYTKLSKEERDKKYKANPVSEEAYKLMEASAKRVEKKKRVEKYVDKDGKRRSKTVYEEWQPYNPSVNLYDQENYIEILKRGMKKYYGVGLNKHKHRYLNETNQQYKEKIGPKQQKKKPKDDGLKLISISREDFAKMKF